MRIEVSSNKIEDIYSIPMKNKYFIIVEHMKKRAPKGEHWVFEVFDSKMKKKGNKTTYLPRDFYLFDYKLLGDTVVWICFAETDGKNANFMLYRLDLNTLYMKHAYIKGNRKSRLDRIEVLNNKLFIIGDNLEHISEQVNEIKMPNGVEFVVSPFPEYSSVISSVTDNHNVLSVIVKGRKDPEKGLFLYEYSENSSAFTKSKLPVSTGINIIDGNLIEGSKGDLLFMGTYNTQSGRQSANENTTVEGTYLGKISNSSFTFFKTNTFSDFRNVYSTLDYRTAIKVKQKKSKGKDVKLSFKLLVHDDFIRQGDNYIMIAESYYPEYHYENNFDTRGYMYQTEVFDGYNTSNCIVVAFNEEGNLLWDNYMHISDMRSYSLQENILVFPEVDSSIVIAYYYNGHIISKSVKGNDVVFKKTEEKIETVFQENVISEELCHIEAWYDKYFILSGHQIVIGRNSKKRKVYFFNLVSFD